MQRTGLSVGYPAWNLLYYTLLCGLPPERAEPVVIETGTNYGASTIVMAQALEDRGGTGILETVELEEGAVDKARSNVEAAGLSDRVRFNVADSLAFLEELAGRVDQIDFIFLDDGHGGDHVVAELEIVVPKIAPRGKIYFDNTERGGVAAALGELRRVHGAARRIPELLLGPARQRDMAAGLSLRAATHQPPTATSYIRPLDGDLLTRGAFRPSD